MSFNYSSAARFFWSYIWDLLVEKRESALNGVLEVRYRQGKLVLNSATANYSYDSLHRVFQRTFRHINLKKRKTENVLILGFGAGSIASILTEELFLHPKMTAVEHDQVVIDLGRKYFNTSRFTNLSLVCADASDFVFSCTAKFDLLVVDLFRDREVPSKFTEKIFLKRLSELCSPEGLICFNYMVNSLKHQDQILRMNELFVSFGMKTEVFSPQPLNRVLLVRN